MLVCSSERKTLSSKRRAAGRCLLKERTARAGGEGESSLGTSNKNWALSFVLSSTHAPSTMPTR